MAYLQANNISKFYGQKAVLKEVNIKVYLGEIVAILGPNGAGKTTCFDIISGLLAPTSGNIFIDENDVTILPIYKRANLGIGYLPQEASIFKGLTVEENIEAIIEYKEKDKNERQKKLTNLLNDFAISHLRKQNASLLSGGERRRLEIARCLASDPKFLMLDEPLAGIDPISISDIKQMIFHLKDRGIGVLITDHNVRDMLNIVDRAYIIYDGEVLMSGTPKEIINDKRVKNLYLGNIFDH